jgi:Zn-dependent peptidase ImmA (M78 family)
VLLVDNLGSWHSTLPVYAFRGFAIADEIAPFVAINANDSKGAWCFTLMHELAHIALGDTGVSGGRFDNQLEKFCNDVASELLLPAVELGKIHVTQTTELDDAKSLIKDFARQRNVSGTMVAYRLYRAGKFDYTRFDTLRIAFRQDFLDYQARLRERNRQKEGGPTYQILRSHRVGNALIRLVDRMMYSGAITTTKAGKVLGVSAKNVQSLLEAARPAHA